MNKEVENKKLKEKKEKEQNVSREVSLQELEQVTGGGSSVTSRKPINMS